MQVIFSWHIEGPLLGKTTWHRLDPSDGMDHRRWLAVPSDLPYALPQILLRQPVFLYTRALQARPVQAIYSPLHALRQFARWLLAKPYRFRRGVPFGATKNPHNWQKISPQLTSS